MLRGVLITLPDGTQVLGAVFPDDKLYVHEPICDLWANEQDFIDLYTGATIELIGPVIALALAREEATKQYNQNRFDLDNGYKNIMGMFATLDAGAIPVVGKD